MHPRPDPVDRTPSPSFPEGLTFTTSALLDELEDECCAPETGCYVIQDQKELQELRAHTLYGAGSEEILTCLDGRSLVILRHVLHAPRAQGTVIRAGRTVHDPLGSGLQPEDFARMGEVFPGLTPLPSLSAVREQLRGAQETPACRPLPLALPACSY